MIFLTHLGLLSLKITSTNYQSCRVSHFRKIMKNHEKVIKDIRLYSSISLQIIQCSNFSHLFGRKSNFACFLLNQIGRNYHNFLILMLNIYCKPLILGQALIQTPGIFSLGAGYHFVVNLWQNNHKKFCEILIICSRLALTYPTNDNLVTTDIWPKVLEVFE